jgi:hypothetical protein
VPDELKGKELRASVEYSAGPFKLKKEDITFKVK